MDRHGLGHSYVIQYELDGVMGISPPPINCVASLNTHDMPPFAAFWQGSDIPQRQELGLLDEAEAAVERSRRQQAKEAVVRYLIDEGWLERDSMDVQAILQAILKSLSASHGRVILINLEDLWLETRPQNIPCTRDEYPNWRAKASYDLETFSTLPQVRETLRQVDAVRKQGRS
jgi:4-alpha-glucanotransferase